MDQPSGVTRRVFYGQLVAAASRLPLDPNPTLKTPAQFTLIGKPLRRLDTPAKCDGSAVFGIDVTVPDMLNAAIRIAPTFTGTLVHVRNEDAVAKMEGVRRIVKLPSAVAIVAYTFWQAKRAADRLEAEFDPPEAGRWTTEKPASRWAMTINERHRAWV